MVLSGSREDAGVVKDGGEWRWAVEGYGWEGLSVGSEAVSIRALVDQGIHRMTGWKAIIVCVEQIDLKE